MSKPTDTNIAQNCEKPWKHDAVSGHHSLTSEFKDNEACRLVKTSNLLIKMINDPRENTNKQMNSIQDLERKVSHRGKNQQNAKKINSVTGTKTVD